MAADLQEGRRRGVRGTPTFVITAAGFERTVPRLMDNGALRQLIEQALGKATP